jgi:hypothetical protein
MSVSRKSGKSGLLKVGKNVDDNNESYGFLAPAIIRSLLRRLFPKILYIVFL